MANNSGGQPSWKSPFLNPQTLETKTFTWRLRPHLTNTALPTTSTTKSNKSTIISAGTSRNSNNVLNNSSSVLSKMPNVNSSHEEEQFIRFQEFEIEAGQSLGLHAIWSLFLVSCGSTKKSNTNITNASSADSDFIGLFLRRVLKTAKESQPVYFLPDVNDEEVFVRYKIEIMDHDGDVLYTKECETTARDKLEVGYWDWKKIVPVASFQCCGKSKLKEASGADELLLMRISFTMINRRKEIDKSRASSAVTPPSEEEVGVRDAANAFLNFVTDSRSLQPDVVIEITNRRKFLVHKKILIERSPVFLKMLSADMNEKSKGVVKLDDVSANTMELVLKHIYTGQLEEEWTTNPVTVTELIYASEKYWLPALKEFCNKHLVKAATKNNCYKLMEVAQLHNLEQATDDLMAFASVGISSANNSRKGSEESIDVKR